MLTIDNNITDPEFATEDLLKALVLQYSTTLSLGGVGATCTVSDTSFNTARELDLRVSYKYSARGDGSYTVTLEDPVRDVEERLDNAFIDRDQPDRASFVKAANKLFGYDLS